jgi:hypothetical protein
VLTGSRALQQLGQQLDSQTQSLLSKSKSAAMSFLRDFYSSSKEEAPASVAAPSGDRGDAKGTGGGTGGEAEAEAEAVAARKKHIADVHTALHAASGSRGSSKGRVEGEEEESISKTFEDWNSV